MNRPPAPFWAAPITWLPLAFLGAFFAYPLVSILSTSLAGEAQTTLLATLLDPSVLRIAAWTSGQALLSSLMTVLLALPGAAILAQVHFPGKRLAASLISVPFVLPTVAVAAAFSTLTSPDTLAGRLMATILEPRENPRLAPIVAAHVFYNFGLAARIIASAWEHIPSCIPEAAATLGASGWTRFFRIHLPLLAPSLAATGILIFALCFSSFGIVLLLGGGRLATVEVAIYNAAVGRLDLGAAASLAILQMGVSALLFWALARLGRTDSPLGSAPPARTWQTLPSWIQGAVLGYSALVLLGIITPLGALVLESLRIHDQWTLEAYRLLIHAPRTSALAAPPLDSLANSLTYAALAVAIALPCGVAVALGLRSSRGRRTLETLCMLPMTTSAATLGLGLLLALHTPWWDGRTSIWAIPIAHALVAFPLVLRTIQPAVDSIPAHLLQGAATLGATPWTTLCRITLPLLARPMAVAASFAAAVSIGEFGASLFLVRPNTPTLPIAIYRTLSLPGSLNYAQAMALCTIVMLVCTLFGLTAQWLSSSQGQRTP